MSGTYDLDDCARSWEPWLKEFDEHMAPMFARRGFSRDATLVAYHLNVVHNDLSTDREDRDAGDGWRS